MVNGSKPAGYVLEWWEVHSSGARVSEAFVRLKAPDGRISPRTAAKDDSPIEALFKVVQGAVSVPVVVVDQVVLDNGKKSSSRASMVVTVGEPGVVGSATSHSDNVLEASVLAFVTAINNAMVARPVVMVA